MSYLECYHREETQNRPFLEFERPSKRAIEVYRSSQTVLKRELDYEPWLQKELWPAGSPQPGRETRILSRVFALET